MYEIASKDNFLGINPNSGCLTLVTSAQVADVMTAADLVTAKTSVKVDSTRCCSLVIAHTGLNWVKGNGKLNTLSQLIPEEKASR